MTFSPVASSRGTRGAASFVAALGGVLLGASLASAQGAAASPHPQPSMELPGGSAALARVVGVDEATPRSWVLLNTIRALWESPEGADPAADRRRAEILRYLRGLRAASGGEAVPALLPPEAWSIVLGSPGSREGAGSPALAILENRAASLLYYGMAALDSETRAFVASQPDLLRSLSERGRVGVFATLSAGLRVRDGRVVVPGEPDAIPLWEPLADERVTNPAAFILKLLAKDGGRLALLYDGIAHVDEGTRAFALGLGLPAERRSERFRKLYDAAGAALDRWQPNERPFDRAPFDAVHLLMSMTIGADGRPHGPPWRRLWRGVFDPFVVEADKIDRSDTEVMDAAEVVELVSVGNAVERRRRAEVWLFADRVLRDVPEQSMADLFGVLKAFGRYPALFVTLERMGVTSPRTYAAAVAACRRLDADRRLWQFQAALSILERARSARTIDAAAANDLVQALLAATPESGEYLGGVARWLEREFLARVGDAGVAGDVPAEQRIEARVFAAMSGVSSPANADVAALPRIEWEGLRYRFDPAGTVMRRLTQVREQQGGPSLDGALAFARAADALAGASTREAALDAVQRASEAAVALRAPDGAPRGRWADRDDRKVAELVRETADRVKASRDFEAKRMAGLAKPLQEVGDGYLADVLGTLAYAPHLGEPGGPALLAGDPARVHDFRFVKTGTELGARSAWDLPVEVREKGVGWRVTGSLLGLDIALGRFSLRRVTRETIPAAPRLSDAVRQAFTETLLFSTALDASPAAAAALLAAVDRGRARVAELTAASADVQALAAAAEIDEWRIQALSWTMAEEPDRRLELFSLAELARLGQLDPRTPGLDGWGTSAFSLDRGPRAAYPVRLPWATLSGRHGSRAVPALVPDLTIGMMQSAVRLKLPAQVAVGILAMATQDFIDTLRTAHEDDWLAMVRHARAIAAGPAEDYVAGLTITGPLVPDETETEHGPGR